MQEPHWTNRRTKGCRSLVKKLIGRRFLKQPENGLNETPAPTPATIYYMNLSGAKSKITNINSWLLTSVFDIVVLTETWFDSTIVSSEITAGTKYNIIRRDRATFSSNKQKGGGVAILHDIGIECASLENKFSSKKHVLESIMVIIRNPFTNKQTFLCACYLPPRTHSVAIKNLRDILQFAWIISA